MGHDMKIRYQLAEIDNNPNWTQAGNLSETLQVTRRRADKPGGPYRLKERGEEQWGHPQGLPSAMSNLRRRLSAASVGDLMLLRTNADRENGPILGVRKVHVHETQKNNIPPVPYCTPAIADVWRAVWGEFGSRISSWGIFNCRKISGSTTYSQHAWANAWDIRGTTSTLEDVARYLNNNKSRLGIANILWRVPNHYDHVHVDCHPTRTGVPPCA